VLSCDSLVSHDIVNKKIVSHDIEKTHIVGNRASLLVCSISKSVLKDIEAHLVRCGRGLHMSHEGKACWSSHVCVDFERLIYIVDPEQNGLSF
jgi:hypothetical protein